MAEDTTPTPGARPPLDADVCAEVDRLGPELIAFLQKLMSFRTASQNPDYHEYPAQATACLDVVESFLHDSAFETQRWDAAPSTFAAHPVLAGRLAGCGSGRSITINGHLDVVPSSDWVSEVRNG